MGMRGRKRALGAQFDFLACKRVDTKLSTIFNLAPCFAASVLEGLQHLLVNSLGNKSRIKRNEIKSTQYL